MMFKRKLLRIAAVLLLTCFLLCSFCACSEKVGAGHIDNTTVLKIGDYKVTMDQYRYLCYKIRDSYDGGDRSYWAQHPEAQEKFFQDVLKELSAIYAIYALAEEYEVELTKEEETQLNDVMRSYIKSYESEEAFLEEAARNHMTGDLVRMEVELEMLQNKLYQKLTDARSGVIASDDATVEAAITQGQFYCVRYIMLQHVKDDAVSQSQNRAVLQELRERVAAGGDLATVYQNARDKANNTQNVTYQLNSGNLQNGSYFILGYQDALCENAVLALQYGQVSEVLETEDYLIFYQRFACDTSYMAGEGFANLRAQLVQKRFSEICANRANELMGTIKYKSAYTGAFSVNQ